MFLPWRGCLRRRAQLFAITQRDLWAKCVVGQDLGSCRVVRLYQHRIVTVHCIAIVSLGGLTC